MALESSLHIIKFELGHGGRIRKGLFNLSQSRHVLLGLPLVTAGLCQFPLSSPLRESISQAWIDKLSGDTTGNRTRTLQLERLMCLPVYTMVPYSRILPYLRGSCDFNRHSRPQGFSLRIFLVPPKVSQDLSISPNQNSFLIFLRLPNKLIAGILALFGTVVFVIGIDPCRRFTNPSQVLLAEKKSF